MGPQGVPQEYEAGGDADYVSAAGWGFCTRAGGSPCIENKCHMFWAARDCEAGENADYVSVAGLLWASVMGAAGLHEKKPYGCSGLSRSMRQAGNADYVSVAGWGAF